MRFSAAFLALASSASGLSLFRGDSDVTINQDLDIPGESPIQLCDTDHSDDLVKITSIDLLPNPPEAYV